MATDSSTAASSIAPYAMPTHRDLYYGGAWHTPLGGYLDTFNPATGENLGPCAEANAADIDAVTQAAQRAFKEWRKTKPLQRAELLKKAALTLRNNAEELAYIDAANCGNPIKEMLSDVRVAAMQIEYFAGLVTELRGFTTPMGEGIVNMTLREPYGVCARITAYNHPLMFTAAKFGAVLAAGNTAIMKPPPQAPLSSYRMMELLDGILPPGVLNLVSGGRECGEALVQHPKIPVVSLVGSVPTGRAVAKGAADRLKHVFLELGGKNAMIIYPDANIEQAIAGAVKGMNFTWCGQSCGSTSRLFLHEDIYERVLDGIVAAVKHYRPGIPTDMNTTMGALISKAQYDKVLSYIEIAKSQGATLITGGTRPSDKNLDKGWFIEPTIFGDVTQDMRIAQEEVFGPILSVIKWRDEESLFEQINSVDYGLTGAIYTRSLSNAHRAVERMEAGFIWVNNAGPHFLGTPYGGYKQSGLGREECMEELLQFTQMKNVNLNF